MKEKTENQIATVTFLNREQVDFMDKLSKDYFFKYGHKLPRGKILSELVNLLMEIGITVDELDLENEGLAKALKRLFKNEHKTYA